MKTQQFNWLCRRLKLIMKVIPLYDVKRGGDNKLQDSLFFKYIVIFYVQNHQRPGWSVKWINCILLKQLLCDILHSNNSEWLKKAKLLFFFLFCTLTLEHDSTISRDHFVNIEQGYRYKLTFQFFPFFFIIGYFKAEWNFKDATW